VRIRTKALIAGLGLMTVTAVAAPAAFAADTTTTSTPQNATTSATTTGEAKYASEADKACAETLAGGGSVEDCQKAPSPLKPENNEIIWGSAAFLVLLIAMWKFGVPAVKNMEKAREDRIRNDLETAERARTEAEAERTQYQSQIAGARDEAARIIDEARQAADGVRRELTQRAEAEAQQLRQKAQDDIRLATERAMADLRQQVATMSVELASRIVERNLDPATQQQLIESYISSVGSN
jgi:F-type H+-transporting ATPase subunit b